MLDRHANSSELSYTPVTKSCTKSGTFTDLLCHGGYAKVAPSSLQSISQYSGHDVTKPVYPGLPASREILFRGTTGRRCVLLSDDVTSVSLRPCNAGWWWGAEGSCYRQRCFVSRKTRRVMTSSEVQNDFNRSPRVETCVMHRNVGLST